MKKISLFLVFVSVLLFGLTGFCLAQESFKYRVSFEPTGAILRPGESVNATLKIDLVSGSSKSVNIAFLGKPPRVTISGLKYTCKKLPCYQNLTFKAAQDVKPQVAPIAFFVYRLSWPDFGFEAAPFVLIIVKL